MKNIKDKLVVEIGMNHLGESTHFIKYSDFIIKNQIKLTTIQIREENYYKKENRKLLLSQNIINDQFIRLQNAGVKVGLAIADNNFNKFTKNYKVDFYKILSWKADDIELIDKILENEKPIYISLGTLSSENIKKLIKKIENKSKLINLIHTQLNYEIDDLNLNFISKLKNETSMPISYGHHAKNTTLPIIQSITLGVDKIFIYIKLDDSIIYPDNDHAINLCDFDQLVSDLNTCMRFLGEETKSETENIIEQLHNERC